MERSFVVGSAATDEKSAWAKVGELGLQKQFLNTDPSSVTFGKLAEKYLATFPFNKKSTRDLNRQVIRNVLMKRWTSAVAITLKPESWAPAYADSRSRIRKSTIRPVRSYGT